MRYTLYDPADVHRLGQKHKKYMLNAAILAVLTGAVVGVLLMRTNAQNEKIMRYTAEAAAVGLGWAVIGLIMRATACRRYQKHVSVMLAEPGEEFDGILNAPGKPCKLPGGLGYRPVTLDMDGLIKYLRVSEKNVHRLPPAGTRVRLWAVHGFITAWKEGK